MTRFYELINFKKLKPSRVVILYENDYWIRKLILKEIPAVTIDIYPKIELYVSYNIIRRFIIRLVKLIWKCINKKEGVKLSRHDIYVNYLLSCFDEMGAEIVITNIDNSPIFHYLDFVDSSPRVYIAIQNGARTIACVRDSLPKMPGKFSKIYLSNFYCFGKRDIDLFERHGHIITNYFPVGSLVAGFYKDELSSKICNYSFDICLISQWSEHFFSEIIGDCFTSQVARKNEAGISILNKFLVQLLGETSLNLVVCLRNENSTEEEHYYKSIFGNSVQIVKSDRSNFSTYFTAEKSHLTIALNSTMLLEVMSFNQKVMWCNINNDEHFDMSEAGLSYFNGNCYGEFKRHVQYLLNLPLEEFLTSIREGSRYINNYDINNPPHKIIRTKIIDTLRDKKG